MAEKSKKKFPLVFRLGLILFGLLLVLLMEGMLRILTPPAPACKDDPFVGFAGKERLFTKTERLSMPYYEINPRMAKFFNPESFPAKKAENEFRIFVLGGSVSKGFPFNELGSFSRFLENGLNEIYPSKAFQVINAGGFGYASYRVVRVLREAINYDPDLMVVMSGHNEFLEKRTYGEIQDQSPVLVALITFFSNFRTYCLLKTAVFKLRGPDARPLINPDVTWDKYVRDPVQMDRTLEHYEYNLREMADICRGAGVPVIFVTLPSNLRDFEPYHSEHSDGLSEADMNEWERAYSKGHESVLFGEIDQALGYFTIAEKIDPEYAELYFNLGKVLVKKGLWDRGREKFWLAVRYDAWPMRAFQEMNKMIRGLAQGNGVYISEAEKAFSEGSKGRIPGDDWFLDHCHPDLKGNIVISRSIIEAMIQNKLIRAAPDWPEAYEKISQNYIQGLPQYLLAESYYRAAFEIGLNVRRIDRGLEMTRRARELDPENPKISDLIRTLTELKETSSGR